MVELGTISQHLQVPGTGLPLSGAHEAPVSVQGASGQAMGFKLEMIPDMTSMLNDSFEELSAMFEEKTTKTMGERKLGEERRRDARFEAKVRFWVEKLPDMPRHEVIERMLRQLRQAGTAMGMGTLMRMLGDASSDPTHQFAMLDCLEDALGEGEAGLRELVREARGELERLRGGEVRVGLNLADLFQARGDAPEAQAGLRDLYRGEILGFEDPQTCFRALVEQRGPERLGEAIEFLLRACSADMASSTPSMAPEELRRIVVDLQSVEVLKTVLERMTQLCGRMANVFGESMQASSYDLTGRLLELTHQAFLDGRIMESYVSHTGIKKLFPKMDFMRELMLVMRSMSMRCFPNDDSRVRLLDASQSYLDELVSALEAEEASSSSESPGSGLLEELAVL